jgi:hypothetical protein
MDSHSLSLLAILNKDTSIDELNTQTYNSIHLWKQHNNQHHSVLIIEWHRHDPNIQLIVLEFDDEDQVDQFDP